jgi:outer membrane protein TolC
MNRVARTASILALPLFIGGCAATAQEALYGDSLAGFGTVQAATRTATGKNAVWIQDRQTADRTTSQVRGMVQGKTVGADTAVQVALLNNRGLQAAYAELGLSATDAWQETMFVNPTASIGVLGIGAPELGAFRALEGMIVNNIFALVTRDRRIDIADTRFRKAQLDAAVATLSLAAETRRAWVEAASAWERVAYLNQARAAADAASELAARLGESGALNKSGQAREHVFNAELAGETARARLAARTAKAELTRLMGLWGSDIEYEVPNQLPSLPKTLARVESIETDALGHRADLKAAALELEALAKQYGLTEATKYATDIALVAGLEAEGEIEDGDRDVSVSPNLDLEVEFAIPIFDSGRARMRRAELEYMAAANRLAEKAVNVRSEARSAYDEYKSTYDIARHYRNNVLPLRTTIEEEALLTYNGMITSTFELLADTRAKIDSVLLSVDAKRDFWLAEANLAPTIYGGRSGGSAGGGEAAAVADAGEAAGH